MRNRLEILMVTISLVIGTGDAFADDDDASAMLRYRASEDSYRSGGVVVRENGVTETMSREQYLERRAEREYKQSQRSADNPTITDDETDTTIVNPEWVKKNDLQKLQEVTALGGQISNAGSGFTKDPKTASYIAAGGSGLGAVGALAGSAHHLKHAGVFSDASTANENAAENTRSRLTTINDRIEQERSAIVPESEQKNSENVQHREAIAKLNKEKINLESKLKKQEALGSQYSIASGANYLMSGLGVVSSAAMGWTASMQLDQGRKLAADQEYCGKHPNEFPRCTDVVPQDNNRPFDPNQNPSVSLSDPGFSGVTQEGAGEDPLSPASASTAGLGAAPASTGSPSAFGGGLGGGSGEERKPAQEKQELDDIGGSGFSGDQMYEGGGGDIDQLGSGSAVTSITAPSLSGFDISQFLPTNVREDEFGSFYAAKINDKEKEEERLLLGKESPSLFTRINKAYQKKAHEMIKEVL